MLLIFKYILSRCQFIPFRDFEHRFMCFVCVDRGATSTGWRSRCFTLSQSWVRRSRCFTLSQSWVRKWVPTTKLARLSRTCSHVNIRITMECINIFCCTWLRCWRSSFLSRVPGVVIYRFWFCICNSILNNNNAVCISITHYLTERTKSRHYTTPSRFGTNIHYSRSGVYKWCDRFSSTTSNPGVSFDIYFFHDDCLPPKT